MLAEDDLRIMLIGDLDSSFEQMVLSYQHRLYGFALRLSGNPQDAEEIAQDAFVRAYRALPGYSAEQRSTLAIRPWLYQIALNVYRNRVRRHTLRQIPLDPGDDDDRSSPAYQIESDRRERPDVAAEAGEGRRELAALLTALPEHLRVAVILRHVEGMGYDEIAALLAQPVGTVKAHVHRGTQRVREAFVAARLLEVR
ncbi:MAG TPA: sigma-70 family RNA polymerase sigma factor [Ktedonobacterales bacterium]